MLIYGGGKRVWLLGGIYPKNGCVTWWVLGGEDDVKGW